MVDGRSDGVLKKKASGNCMSHEIPCKNHVVLQILAAVEPLQSYISRFSGTASCDNCGWGVGWWRSVLQGS